MTKVMFPASYKKWAAAKGCPVRSHYPFIFFITFSIFGASTRKSK